MCYQTSAGQRFVLLLIIIIHVLYKYIFVKIQCNHHVALLHQINDTSGVDRGRNRNQQPRCWVEQLVSFTYVRLVHVAGRQLTSDLLDDFIVDVRVKVLTDLTHKPGLWKMNKQPGGYRLCVGYLNLILVTFWCYF